MRIFPVAENVCAISHNDFILKLYGEIHASESRMFLSTCTFDFRLNTDQQQKSMS